jgi:hypothetical protein
LSIEVPALGTVPKEFAGLWVAKSPDTASQILRKPERLGYIGMGNELCSMFAKMIKMLCVLPIKLLIFRKPSNITRPSRAARPLADKTLDEIKEVEPSHRQPAAVGAPVRKVVGIILAILMFRHRRFAQ